ncbi:GntR family transcriptional regulator [Xenorhabdus nematophila]|uniref:GntR family transcriptional regulator n=1 Tax=Xenorhabdus nematophila TaxID=628 RepID=UPI000A563E08|nr:GntR family transcriptional regulator [Xenorhabdus nematophila]
MEITAKTASDIFEQVRSSVLTGKLKPGTALPSVRELASELEINRNTVAAAYKKTGRSWYCYQSRQKGDIHQRS